jgi:hypothetical protein
VPNLAFTLTVLDQSRAHPAMTPEVGNLLAQPYAALGALGPDIFRYAPLSKDVADRLTALAAKSSPSLNMLSPDDLNEIRAKPLSAAYTLLFRRIVLPNWPTFGRIHDFLQQVQTIVAARDEIALTELLPQLSSIQADIQHLHTTSPAATALIGLARSIQTPTEAPGCRPYELLRWRRTGDFARYLIEHAPTHGRQAQAFAAGWLLHYTTAITAEPYLNNIVGGPNRTHPARNRLAGNYVDAFIWGRFHAGATHDPATDVWTPPYAHWTSLCTANLQARFTVNDLDVGSNGSIPDVAFGFAKGRVTTTLTAGFAPGVSALFGEALDAVYPERPVDLTADSLLEAYVGALAVYWLMTSGSGFMGPHTTVPASPACMSPGRTMGGVALQGSPTAHSSRSQDSQGVALRGSPTAHSSRSRGVPGTKLAPAPAMRPGADPTAIIPAILTASIHLLGGLVSAAATLIAELFEPVVNWTNVECNLFSVQQALFSAESAMHDLFVSVGLAYPRPERLGRVSGGVILPSRDLGPLTDPPLTKTHAAAASPVPPDQYLDMVVTDPIHNGGIRMSVGGSGVSLGGCVANAVDLLTDLPAALPNLNLDGDLIFDKESST